MPHYHVHDCSSALAKTPLDTFFWHFQVYYPGETICGKVIVGVLEEIMVVGISVEFCGRVKTCWCEGAGEEKKTHNGDDVLFKNTKVSF